MTEGTFAKGILGVADFQCAMRTLSKSRHPYGSMSGFEPKEPKITGDGIS